MILLIIDRFKMTEKIKISVRKLKLKKGEGYFKDKNYFYIINKDGSLKYKVSKKIARV